MKITKLTHSCLLVELPKRTALFDPGIFSQESVNIESLQYLDDIIITHEHSDHMHIPLIQALVKKFPNVRITTTENAAKQLAEQGITASHEPGEGIELFEAAHEPLEPLGHAPENNGVHYEGKLTHPGDCHSFSATKEILALPITAPWGRQVRAAELALELKPKYIIPVHDWFLNDEARQSTYNRFESLCAEHGITFLKPVNGEPFNL